MFLRWSTSKIMFSVPDLDPKWPPSADIVLTSEPICISSPFVFIRTHLYQQSICFYQNSFVLAVHLFLLEPVCVSCPFVFIRTHLCQQSICFYQNPFVSVVHLFLLEPVCVSCPFVFIRTHLYQKSICFYQNLFVSVVHLFLLESICVSCPFVFIRTHLCLQSICFYQNLFVSVVRLFLLEPICVSCPFVFSSPGPKVQVNYCHHLASVVCRLETFHISSFFSETTGPIGTKLSRNFPWMVLYKVTVFRSSRIFNMADKANNML